MSARTVRAGISAVVILGALGLLLFQTASESAAYYKRVDEVMPDPQAWYGKNMNLHGYVVEGSIRRRPNSLDWRFDIQNGSHIVQASYTGVVPDTFKDGSEVVVKGQLTPEGFQVQEDGVMAKCPSKYEAQQQPASY
jgi:cytochrome c-type biogenesis protein CcmE